MIARKYIKENPVEHVQQKAEHEKYRKDLSEDMLKKMSEHLLSTDKYFSLACMMQYYTLIRPGELSNLKIGDISVSKQTVFVSKEFSKNHKDAEVGVNDNIIKLMIDLGVLSHPTNEYLFSKKFMPGEEHVGADQFNKRWKKMRTALGWADCYRFYSLKDTGIRDLANSEGVVVARDQARHSDISTTNKYIQKHGVRRAPFISMALSLWERIRKRRLQKKKWRTKNELRRDRRTDMGVLQPRLPCHAEGDLGVHLSDIRVHFVQVLLHLLSLLDDGAQLISISRCPLEELHGAFVNEVHGR